MNLKGVSKDTWVRIIVLVLILVNQVSVTVFGNQLLPFSDEQLYEGISTGLTIAVAIWTTWKNNSFTTEAQRADQLIKK
jgi:SPP1 family holin